MTKDQFIFEKLKREGECWHDYDYKWVNQNSAAWICEGCGHTVQHPINFLSNPAFTTPDGFFWMWERIVEDSCLFSKFWTYVTDQAPWTEDVWTAIHLTYPTRLRDEIANYLGWEVK